MNTLSVPPRPNTGLVGAQVGEAVAPDHGEGFSDSRERGYLNRLRLMEYGDGIDGGDDPAFGFRRWRRMGRRGFAPQASGGHSPFLAAEAVKLPDSDLSTFKPQVPPF